MDNKKCPSVYIIIVNYNGKEQLEYCLPSVAKTDYTNFRVVLVDNNSEDNSVSFVRENYSDVIIIESKKNLGCPGGNNTGIKYAIRNGAKYIVTLNPDVIVDKRWIMEAVNLMESSGKNIGMVFFKTVNGIDRIEEFRKAQMDWSGLEVAEIARGVSDHALLYRCSLFENIGLYDDIYFAYGDDDDLSLRAQRAGYKVLKINVPVWHAISASFKKVPLFASKLSIRNLLRLNIKNRGIRSSLPTIVRLFNYGCNPFLKFDGIEWVFPRYRVSNIFVNFALVMYGIFWNLIFFRETLSIRSFERKKIEETQKELKRLNI